MPTEWEVWWATVVRLGQPIKLVESDFIKKIGELDPVDIYGIEQRLDMM